MSHAKYNSADLRRNVLASFMAVFLFCSLGASDAFSKDMQVLIVGKTADIDFYLKSFEGCEDYFRTIEGYSCISDGPVQSQDANAQARIIQKHLDKGLDAILVAAIDSQTLASGPLIEARKRGIPVITFDADLLPAHENLRAAYVGTNNFKLGIALGAAALKYKASGSLSNVCIQSGVISTPNLNERISGVRFALSGGESISRLTGTNGWREMSRCPLYSDGEPARALRQLDYTLQHHSPVVFIAVAGFAQFSPDYAQTVRMHSDKLESGEKVIISADAEPVQIENLLKGYSSVNIGQRPYEMGYKSAQMMHDVLAHGIIPGQSVNYIGFFHCTRENAQSCQNTVEERLIRNDRPGNRE